MGFILIPTSHFFLQQSVIPLRPSHYSSATPPLRRILFLQREKAMALTVDVERRQGVLKQLENKVKDNNNGTPRVFPSEPSRRYPFGEILIYQEIY